jgi:hypothetical protein
VLYLVRPLEIGTPAFRLFIVAVICLATFTGCLIVLGLDAEDREVLGMIQARFRRLRPLAGC